MSEARGWRSRRYLAATTIGLVIATLLFVAATILAAERGTFVYYVQIPIALALIAVWGYRLNAILKTSKNSV